MRYSEIIESHFGTALGPEVDAYLAGTPGIIALTDSSKLLNMIKSPKLREAARAAIAVLNDWREGERKVYRVIAIADYKNEHEAEGDYADLAAAKAWLQTLEPSKPLGNHWSRVFHGEHGGTKGAGIGYDPDAEGFPVLLAATVSDESVRWGTTILHNILYPHEEEITVMGSVYLRYIEIDDDFYQMNKTMTSGPYNEDY